MLPLSEVLSRINDEYASRPRRSYGTPIAGVLVPLFSRDGQTYVVLTKRSSKLKHHPGQISFPGGRVDPSDNDIISTALRETNEEIGVQQDEIEVIGKLDDFKTPWFACVTPVYAKIKPHEKYVLSEDELDYVLEVPLEDLLHVHHWEEMREANNMRRSLHFYDWHNEVIWGATAGLIHDLLELFVDQTVTEVKVGS